MAEQSQNPVSPRHDFFQTETQVTVSVYVRNCKQDEVQLDVEERALRLTIRGNGVEGPITHELHIAPLYGPIDRTNSGLRVLGSKIEVALQKAKPGSRWPKLAGQQGQQPPAASATPPTTSSGHTSTNVAATTTSPDASTSAPLRPHRSKWDSFKDDDDQEAESKEAAGGDEGGIDAFFKKLYADADDDTRRAMMKSYQESGGTALSTNWAEVSKGKVETKPPEGMEARKW